MNPAVVNGAELADRSTWGQVRGGEQSGRWSFGWWEQADLVSQVTEMDPEGHRKRQVRKKMLEGKTAKTQEN